jgi:hypothetical protein
MPQVVVTAQVEDLEKWESGFRTHGDLFRGQTITKPIGIAMREGNEIAVRFEPDDLDAFIKSMDSSATHEAMAVDGIKRDTVKVYVFDKEFVL